MPSFGLMFGDFLNSLNEETSAIALITSSYFSALSFAGLFTNTLFRKFSIRTVGVAGGTLYFIGSFMTVFVTSMNQLLVAFSVFQGAGFGLMIPAAYTTFNAYFVEKRVMMMSIAQTLIGLGTMGYPIMVQTLMDLYGFRGCMAVIAAVNAHAILGMMVMHPVAWHMKEIRITSLASAEDEEEAAVTEADTRELKPFQFICNHHIHWFSFALFPCLSCAVMQPKSGSDIKIFVCDEEGGDAQQLEVAKPKSMDGTLTPKRLSLKHRRVSDLGMNKSERSHSLDPLQFMKDMEMQKRRASSISSLGNWTGAVIVSDATENINKKNGTWSDMNSSTMFVGCWCILKISVFVHWQASGGGLSGLDSAERYDLRQYGAGRFLCALLGCCIFHTATALFIRIGVFKGALLIHHDFVSQDDEHRPLSMYNQIEIWYDDAFQADTAIVIAVGAAADLGSRVFLAALSACVQVKARTVYLAGAIFTVFARFGKQIKLW